MTALADAKPGFRADLDMMRFPELPEAQQNQILQD
jgi:hypothetical protein